MVRNFKNFLKKHNQSANLVLSLLLLFLLTGFGCAKRVPSIKESETGGEKLLWSSQASRPDWIYSEPPQEDGYLTFVGLSKDYASESLARNDAMRSAQRRVVEYLGTLAKSKFEEISTSYGLAGKVIDPTNASRNYEKFLSANVAKKVKTKEAYSERWKIPTGIAYRSFILARVPEVVINESLKSFAKENVAKAQETAREATDNYAREQARKSAEFWKEMESSALMQGD